MGSLGVGVKTDRVEHIVVDLENLETERDKISAEIMVPETIEETDSYQFPEEKNFHMDKEEYILMHENPVKPDTRVLYENQQGPDDYEGKLHRKPTYILLYIVLLPYTIWILLE